MMLRLAASPPPPRRSAADRARRGVASLLILLWVVSAGLAGAEPLDSPEAIERLCAFSAPPESTRPQAGAEAALEAAAARSAATRAYAFARSTRLFDVHAVTLPSRAFRFVSLEPTEPAVSVSAYAPFELFEGLHGLQLEQEEVRFALRDAASVEEVELTHSAGLLELELSFEVAAVAQPGEAFCLSEEGASRRDLRGRLLRARLVHAGTGEALAQMSTPRGVARRVHFGVDEEDALQPSPRVEMTKVDCLDAPPSTAAAPLRPSDGCLGEHAARLLRSEVEGQLLACYQRALGERGRIEGAFTLRVELDERGVIRGPELTIDVLVNERVASCALVTLDGLMMPAALAPRALELGLVIFFKSRRR